MDKLTKQTQQEIDRRDFLKTMGVITAGALVASACSRLPQTVLPTKDMSVKSMSMIPESGSEQSVVLAGVAQAAPEKDLKQAVKDAALNATDFSWLSKGDTVLIKPVLNSGNPYPATTSPIAIKAMVELLKDKGAGRVIITDMSGIEHVRLSPKNLEGSSRELMHASGIAKAALEAGAELYFPEEAGWEAFFEDYPVDATYWEKGIMMPKIIQEVDHIVLMPRCGRHLLLGSSLGLKSAVGYWRTDSRLEYHKKASTIQEKTADANTVKCLRDKQRLVLTDATQILTMKGPDDGFVAKPETGLVIASESIVAHDMVSLAWLLHNRFAMSEEEIANSRDPYSKQFIVSNVNRLFVVPRLGDLGDALQAERLKRNDILSIWDDRVLNRAYEVFGGVPEVRFINVENTTPQETLDVLALSVRQE